MTLTEAKAAILDRVHSGLFGPDFLAMKFLWARGYDGSVAQTYKLQREIAAAVERALEDFRA